MIFRSFLPRISVVLFVIALVLPQAFAARGDNKRFIAITIDDLPVVSKRNDPAVRTSITRRITRTIKRTKIPVTGFVNEKKMYTDGAPDPLQVGYLKSWLDSGADLGNHTFSHLSLHRNSVADFTAEILSGEKITRELMSERGKTLKYFRHPYLMTGLTMDIKAETYSFLKEHNYIVAPVTLDNSDWAFAAAYDTAIVAGDKKMRKRIGKEYVHYIEAKTDYWERQSTKVLGREIKQILLIHANEVNAEYLDRLIKMFKKRGYKFVSLDDALKDEAYQKPDNYVRNAGISWLHRWALDMGREALVPDEPRVPKFVMDYAGLDSE
ncbi:MAG: polysaccharide deacetylase family protein [Pyrinomonadaceae bacterium]